jgi:hypothetical protein
MHTAHFILSVVIAFACATDVLPGCAPATSPVSGLLLPRCYVMDGVPDTQIGCNADLMCQCACTTMCTVPFLGTDVKCNPKCAGQYPSIPMDPDNKCCAGGDDYNPVMCLDYPCCPEDIVCAPNPIAGVTCSLDTESPAFLGCAPVECYTSQCRYSLQYGTVGCCEYTLIDGCTATPTPTSYPNRTATPSRSAYPSASSTPTPISATPSLSRFGVHRLDVLTSGASYVGMSGVVLSVFALVALVCA